MPTQAINPGIVNRLLRESLADIVQMPSPYPSHKGKFIPFLRATDAGMSRLLEVKLDAYR